MSKDTDSKDTENEWTAAVNSTRAAGNQWFGKGDNWCDMSTLNQEEAEPGFYKRELARYDAEAKGAAPRAPPTEAKESSDWFGN